MKNEIRITLRLSADLHQTLEMAANDQTRSLNSQIVFLLRQALETQLPVLPRLAKTPRRINQSDTTD